MDQLGYLQVEVRAIRAPALAREARTLGCLDYVIPEIPEFILGDSAPAGRREDRGPVIEGSAFLQLWHC
ncbi:hypothetical protein ERC79_19550 [Rhodococcus sp. ABRD24]|uniref:hypothetical protein n=1 Tax=Rhodococcus sp. ABRD24 TaxID=2507582 RepID=UPI001039E79E|nr:hypothetical protein [Rhodococcus sp. ABRD24]QBJ97894.1 hypothetical protein ERC79_19550 [Rhodococcus sp. ABRD24]